MVAKTSKPGTAIAKAKVQLPANAEAMMAAEVATFQNRLAAPSGDRISVTQDKTFKLPNGDTGAELSVIIVDFASFNAYYDKPYNPNQIAPPNCFALGAEPIGMVPSDNSPEKQSESCVACWANQWKSSPTSNGKACGNKKRLALLSADADSDSPLMLLEVSPTGLKAFDSYVASVARSYQRPPYGVITDITFDDNVTYASLRFGNPRPCSSAQLALALSLREDAKKRLMVEPDVSSLSETPAGRSRMVAPRGKPVGKPVARKAA